MEHREMEALPFRMHRWYFPYRKHRQIHRLCGESSRRGRCFARQFHDFVRIAKGAVYRRVCMLYNTGRDNHEK
jgi:hypothetical protein